MIDLVMPKGTLQVELLEQRGPKPATCKGCKAEIRFATTPRGKHIPISVREDGRWEAHFASCPNAAEYRKPTAEYNRREYES